MKTASLKKQCYFPNKAQAQPLIKLSELGVDTPQGISVKSEGGYFQQQVFHHDRFMLQTVQAYASQQSSNWVNQEDYIKFLFHLSGRTTLVLDGAGEYELNRPQVLLTSCPEEMVKVNQVSGGVAEKLVSLCVKRDFFTTEMGLSITALPEPLRSVFAPEQPSFALHSLPLSSDMALTLQTVFNHRESASVRSLYYQSKALELMCLVIASAEQQAGMQPFSQTNKLSSHRIECLMHARDIVSKNYVEPPSLEVLAKSVGLSKTSLTTGFTALLSVSVFDYIQQLRMAQAYRLLTEGHQSIESIACAVGYRQASSFTTAFGRYYGYSPSAVR